MKTNRVMVEDRKKKVMMPTMTILRKRDENEKKVKKMKLTDIQLCVLYDCMWKCFPGVASKSLMGF